VPLTAVPVTVWMRARTKVALSGARAQSSTRVRPAALEAL